MVSSSQLFVTPVAFILTVLRNLIFSDALSQSFSYVLIWRPVKFFSYLAALIRTTLYRLYQPKVCSVFLVQLVHLMIESVL